MTVERELMAAGFQPRGDGTLHSPARVTFVPAGDSYYRLSIELSGGDIVRCVVARVALKITREGEKT